MINHELIPTIEDLSLNAWPGYQVQFYDGWVLRYSAFYTHRTNSVEQIAPSQLPYEEKIPFCEEIYRSWETPCMFKISPLTDPLLTGLLAARGYREEHRTCVMAADLTGLPASAFPPLPEAFCRDLPVDRFARLPDLPGFELRLAPRTDALWLDSLFDLKGSISARHQRIVPSMYAAIPKKELALLIFREGQVCATGLGIFDRNAVGVYAIHVRPDVRRCGLGRLLVSTILKAGALRGASFAYLQVVSGNEGARSLYKKLGFEDIYEYHFAVRDV